MTASHSIARYAARSALAAAGLLALATAVLAPINARRLGGERFDRAGQALLARAREVAARTRPGYERSALESLGPASPNGWYLRLDDALEAERPSPGPASAPIDSKGMLWSLEFDGESGLVALPAGSASPRTRAGWLLGATAWPGAVTHERAVATRSCGVPASDA
jgi:hypothetical protein